MSGQLSEREKRQGWKTLFDSYDVARSGTLSALSAAPLTQFRHHHPQAA
jgi:hypothetical protein